MPEDHQTQSLNKRAPKAAGCLITALDIPRICASLSSYGGQLGCGSCTVTLGFAIPFYASKFDISIPATGHLFVVAGIGYFLGVMLSAKVLENDELPVSKTILSAFCICGSGISMFLASVVPSFAAVQLFVFLMFAGIGGVDNFSTIALSEMWGQRVQPWMQTKTAAYSCGGMLPTIIIQSHDFIYTARCAALLCFTSLLGIIVEHMLFILGWADQAHSSSSSSSSSANGRPQSPPEATESTSLMSTAPDATAHSPPHLSTATARTSIDYTAPVAQVGGGVRSRVGSNAHRFLLSIRGEEEVPTMAAVHHMQAMERGYGRQCGAASVSVSASATTSPGAVIDVNAETETETETGVSAVHRNASLERQSSLTRSMQSLSISRSRSRNNSATHASHIGSVIPFAVSRQPHHYHYAPDEEILSTELVLLEQALDAVKFTRQKKQHRSVGNDSDIEAYKQPKSPPLESAVYITGRINAPSSTSGTTSDSGSGNSSGNSSGDDESGSDTDIVRAALDATEYCQVAEQDRENPFFEPSINRTLSFVPTKVVHRLEELEDEFDRQQQHKQHKQQKPKQQQELTSTYNHSGSGGNSIACVPSTINSELDKSTDTTTSAAKVHHPHVFKTARVQLLPMSAKLCLSGMVLLQVGLAASIPGWTSMYITQNHIGSGTTSTGAVVGSIYFFFLTMGAFLSIPLSVGFSTTTLLRMHLLMVSLGVCVIAISGVFGTLLLAPVHPARISDQASDVRKAEEEGGGMGVFVSLCGGYAVMGYGMSVIVPLCLTMVNDYGLTMDPSSVSMAIMGGALGSSLVPTFVGYMISLSPTQGFIFCVLGFGLALPLFYLQAHRVLLAQSAAAAAEATAAGPRVAEMHGHHSSAPTDVSAASTTMPGAPPQVGLYKQPPQNSYQKARQRTRTRSLSRGQSNLEAEVAAAGASYGAVA